MNSNIPKFTTNTHMLYINHLHLIMMINIRENKPTQTHPKSLNKIGNHMCWETGRSLKASMSLSFMTNKSQTPHFKPKPYNFFYDSHLNTIISSSSASRTHLIILAHRSYQWNMALECIARTIFDKRIQNHNFTPLGSHQVKPELI